MATCRCLRKMNKEDMIVEESEMGSKQAKWKIPVKNGDFTALPEKVKLWIVEKAELMRPDNVHLCDGSKREAVELTQMLVHDGVLSELKKYDNCYLCRTDPKDASTVERKTWIVTPNKYDSVTHTAPGIAPIIGQWMDPEAFAAEADDRFPNCMVGRTMYVIPFQMCSTMARLCKFGILLTDSGYVVMCMRIMARVSSCTLYNFDASDFVRCVHSVGVPMPTNRRLINNWPCNPEKLIIAHRPQEREIWSFGSGYGGNSILAKKCFALRIVGVTGHDEGWMAEHMLIMTVAKPGGEKKYCFAAAFASGCGKTNLAMLQSSLPGWTVNCVGNDIAWLQFINGRLVAINPEYGISGIAVGTSNKTNPVAMKTIAKNTIFTNVASTPDGGIFWEGLEDDPVVPDKNVEITTWQNKKWKIGQPGKAAHMNSFFMAPLAQCPSRSRDWDNPAGFEVDAIIFGDRRPRGVPLVYEAFNWTHGVMVGALMKNENELTFGRTTKHDPMGMRPFMGYNFGKYLQNWLDLERPANKMPKIFHVNWFRKSDDGKGKFLWPGFGENIRVLDWMCRRLDGENIGQRYEIGILPEKGTIDLKSMKEPIDWDELFSLPKDYWVQDAKKSKTFVEQQFGPDFPVNLMREMDEQQGRIKDMPKFLQPHLGLDRRN